VTRRGVAAEALAAAFLQEHGLTVIARNYRCRLGEIDIVAVDAGTTVFVEVRQRTSSAFGGAAASITARKRARLIRTARHYLSRMRTMPPCRFDAILVQGDPPRIDWVRNAFGA